MTSRPGGLDPAAIIGFRASAVLEIVDDEGKSVALQIPFVDDSSLVCTVWTDWSLHIEKRANVEIPDYFWPPESYFRRSMIQDVPEGGLEVVSLVTSADEVGVIMAVDIEVAGYQVSARSVGGEIVLSVC